MIKVFLGGPVRTAEGRVYLEQVERLLIEHGFSVWVPHKSIGVIAADASDLTPLGANFEMLRTCGMAVFVLDRERTGTGIELGYLFGLVEAGASSSRIVGVLRDGASVSDLMARYCLNRHGELARSTEELRAIITRPARRRQDVH